VARCAEYCSPNGPSANVVRNISGSTDYAVMPRIELGVLSLLAGLRATNDWRVVGGSELFDDVRTPLTAMGRRHWAFFEERPTSSGAR